MPIKVLVPRLGEGVEEITITKWLKQEGEPVRELEPLLEVNTDKVDTEIPCPAAGTLLKIEMPEGQTAKVGQVLALISSGKDDTLPEPEAHAGIAPVAVPAIVEAASPLPMPSGQASPDGPAHALGFISPVVARIAAEHGLDLGRVKGTGLGGRITKNDVLALVTAVPPDTNLPIPNLPASNLPTLDTLLKHTPMRKQIAAHMLESKHASPHVLTVMEVDMSRVVAHRAANKPAFERQGGALTYTAYFVAASVAALKAYPVVNASWSEEGIVVHADLNIGLATALGDEGLIVPVIKNADRLSLLGLAQAINDLAARARSKKLQPDEVKGGTFTLTNHGINGSLFAMPIINQPQTGILGAGVIQKRAVVVSDAAGNDAIAIRPMVYLSFVFDHRILDGAAADHFLATVKRTLESWS